VFEDVEKALKKCFKGDRTLCLVNLLVSLHQQLDDKVNVNDLLTAVALPLKQVMYAHHYESLQALRTLQVLLEMAHQTKSMA